ncbi:MAG: long-chain fatty acid--CoA ligase [Bdellovibrionales bacterium]
MTETICHKLIERRQKHPNKACVKFVKNERWTEITWKDYVDQIEQIAAGLAQKGIKDGDRVAIYANTRVEWAMTDMAVLSLGAITVPIYPSSIPEDVEFILNNSETKILFCENRQIFERWLLVKNKCPNVQHVVSFESIQSKESNPISIMELKREGAQYLTGKEGFLQHNATKLKIDDLASIVYTSGTTGQPKGVILTHKNIMSEVKDVFNHVGVTDVDLSLTFLPFAHILARVEHFGHTYMGFTMGYAENIDRIRANLIDVKPTFMVAVPRIFEKIYNSMVTQAEASPTKKKIFYWALGIGKEVSQYRIQKKSAPFTTLLQYQVAKKLVFDKLAAKMGGRLRFAISGGAPLSKDIAEFFHAANLLIIEGYGLTETTAAVFANTETEFKFGSVGFPIGDVKYKLANDGEILVKSDKITPGYYKNEEATKDVFVDGWFATGDIGEMDARGFLTITDRKKDLIKTAGGKYVAPQKLENLLKLSKYVSNVLIHGDQKKYIVALITLNYENIESFAKANNISYSDKTQLASNKQVMALIRDVIADVNSKLGSYESIKNFAILPNDFTVEEGEITPSLKVKRKYCDKKYKDTIDKLYGTEA